MGETPLDYLSRLQAAAAPGGYNRDVQAWVDDHSGVARVLRAMETPESEDDIDHHLREVAAVGNGATKPWSFVPCARHHTEDGPNRVCIRPDGHDD